MSAYDGVYLNIGKHDGKKYTLTLKDEILPLMPDGREQSTISYEYDFESQSKLGLFRTVACNEANVSRQREGRCEAIRHEECQAIQHHDEKVEISITKSFNRNT